MATWKLDYFLQSFYSYSLSRWFLWEKILRLSHAVTQRNNKFAFCSIKDNLKKVPFISSNLSETFCWLLKVSFFTQKLSKERKFERKNRRNGWNLKKFLLINLNLFFFRKMFRRFLHFLQQRRRSHPLVALSLFAPAL